MEPENKVEECTKEKYISKKVAQSHLNWIRENSKAKTIPVRVYECNICTSWHLTSKEK
jgi:hypothetical protein